MSANKNNRGTLTDLMLHTRDSVTRCIKDGVGALMIHAIESCEGAALDKLFEHTEMVARGQMSRNQEILPAIVLRTINNHYIDVTLDQMRLFANNGNLHEVVRSVCIQANVDAAAILLPNKLKAERQSQDDIDASQEVALIIGSTQHIRAERAMPIARMSDGKFIGFAETWDLPHSLEAEKYQQFIPESKPTQQQREQAEKVLQRAGVNISHPCEQGIHPYQEKEEIKKQARGYCR